MDGHPGAPALDRTPPTGRLTVTTSTSEGEKASRRSGTVRIVGPLDGASLRQLAGTSDRGGREAAPPPLSHGRARLDE